MRETLILFGFLISLLMTSCNSESNADILRVDWGGIDLTGIDYKDGDCVFIKDSNYFYSGIILDFDKDSAGIWIGICFTNYKDTIKPNMNTLENYKLFGRQIPSGLIFTQCIDCYDLVYINESSIKLENDKIGLIGKIKYDNSKIRIGAIRPTSNIHELIVDYNWGVEQRKKVPDDCKKSKFKVGAITERYFTFDMIK